MLQINQLSFWEKDTYFSNLDFVIIGAGIVGCSAALSLKERFPKAKILMLERSFLPAGASTKNAGFTCFGSASELVADIEKNDASKVWETVEMRWEGLQKLLERCKPERINFKRTGSFDLFTQKDAASFHSSGEKLVYLNQETKKITGFDEVYSSKLPPHEFGLKGIEHAIYNKLEGMIDTGKMMHCLHQKVIEAGVLMLTGIEVLNYASSENSVLIETNKGEINAGDLFITTNGFASQFLKNHDVKPARAQVLITKPIENLKVNGTFHYDAGYYYFRNVGNRILLGGGRNLDFEGETTINIENTDFILNQLKWMLSDIILPNTPFEIEHTWAGIMGVGEEKKPIIEKINSHVFAGVRMGGMGVAIGTVVGEKLAKLI